MSNNKNLDLDLELVNSKDSYRCIVVSTFHLSQACRETLDSLSQDQQCNMVCKRDTGWFVKLYDEAEYNMHDSKGHANPSHLDATLVALLGAGYRMVEFDCDGDTYKSLTCFH